MTDEVGTPLLATKLYIPPRRPGLVPRPRLMAHPNAQSDVTTPIGQELNEALSHVEEEVLHKGNDPVPLLKEVQAELTAKLKEGVADSDRP